MRVKSCPVSIKAAGDHEGTPDGVFEAIVAAYNVDSGGDKIIPGAFADTLAQWKGSGDPIPLYWSHRMDDPDYNIGHVLEAEERDAGLWVKAQIDLDGPKAQQVYRLLKGRRVKMFSFSYDIDVAQPGTDDNGDEILELRKLSLFEVGPTPIGMNQQTDLLAVKAAEAAERERATAPVPAEAAVETHSPAPGDEPAPVADESKSDDPDEPAPAAASADDMKAAAATLATAAQALLATLAGSADPSKSGTTEPSTTDGKATPTPAEPAAPSPDGAKGDAPARPAGTASDRLRMDLALLACEAETL